MKKGLRKQLMNAALVDYLQYCPNTDNTVDIVSILEGTALYPQEIIPYVEEWLDIHCSNGYNSRWTNHGNFISHKADEVAYILCALYQEYEA